MKKLTTIAVMGLVGVFALSGVAMAVTPAEDQDWEGKVFAGSKTSSTPKKGSVGAYLHPFHKNTWPGVQTKTTGSVLVSPPFATAFADVYLDKNLNFNPGAFPGCSLEKVLALDPNVKGAPPSCPKESFLGSGDAAGYARAVNSPAGVYLLTPTLQDRLFASGEKNKVYLYTYSEVSKQNVIVGTVSKASGKYGQKIRFVLPKGLMLPAPGVVSQLTSFDTTIPAKSYKGKALLTLKKCPSNKKINTGFQNFYSNNATAKPGVNPVDGNDFVVSSNSAIINKTAKCK
ncbi:MAG: hypothetical protein KGR19_01310 [Acidobacteria bacterium]|nr:hypothetical protein [Acidobacteriota bacterium]